MEKKRGRSCAFTGKVAAGTGICMDYLVFDKDIRTTLAFVKIFPNADRDFSFYRNPGADMMLAEEELPLAAIAVCPCKIL